MSSTSTKNIVIVGGSYAGLSCAHYLLKHAVSVLQDRASHRIILISKSNQVFCRPACPRAMIADEFFNQEKLFVSIPQLFKQYPKDNFRFIQGTAAELDHTNRNVAVHIAGASETINYYSLIIATGAVTPSPLLSMTQDTESLRVSWNELRNKLRSAKKVVIAGGGPAGVETAGELGEYLNGRSGWFSSKIAKPNVSIVVVSAGSEILPILPPALAKKAGALLAKVGVTVMNNSRVMSVSPPGAGTDDVSTNATITLENGTTLDTDIYIPATGTRPNTSFINDALLDSDGRVKTNKETLRVEKAGPRVYAVGDVGSYARPAVHIILETVPVVCANIKRDLLLGADKEENEVGEDRIFREDTRETQLVPIGKSKGVGAAMGWQLPSFMIWLIKGRDYWLWTTGDLWAGKQWNKES